MGREIGDDNFQNGWLSHLLSIDPFSYTPRPCYPAAIRLPLPSSNQSLFPIKTPLTDREDLEPWTV
jgi:hypothetical protein